MKAKLDPRVDVFVEGAPTFARPVLRHLRGLVHASCGEVEETIKWGKPFFLYRGKIVCAMMAFKAHCGFHLWGPEMREVLREAGYSGEESSGLLGRITRLQDLPDDKVLRGWLKQAFQIAAEERPTKAAPAAGDRASAKKAIKVIETPEDLAVELAKFDGVSERFAAMSPSCRREYIEWIETAKRAETRALRVATATGWIAEGKQRNWKYQAS